MRVVFCNHKIFIAETVVVLTAMATISALDLALQLAKANELKYSSSKKAKKSKKDKKAGKNELVNDVKDKKRKHESIEEDDGNDSDAQEVSEGIVNIEASSKKRISVDAIAASADEVEPTTYPYEVNDDGTVTILFIELISSV